MYKSSRRTLEESGNVPSHETARLRRGTQDATTHSVHAESESSRFSALKESLQSSQKDYESARRDYEKMRNDYEGMRKDYEETRRDNKKLRESYDNFRLETQDLMTRASKYEGEIGQLRKQVEDYKVIEKELEVTKRTVAETSRELRALQIALGDREKLLQIRSTELREAQAYLSRVDIVSHADVLGMVERLNSEIFQLAASVADSFNYDGPSWAHYQLENQFPGVEKAIGGGLKALLLAMRDNGDLACVQMALQAGLLNVAAHIITSWDLTFDGTHNIIFSTLYMAMFNGEPAATCGKWRTLTRQYAKHITEGQNDLQSMSQNIVEHICNILMISGCNGNPAEIRETVWSRFGDKITEVIATSVSLQKAIGEDVISSDLQIICPFFTSEFVAEEMEDINDNGRQKRRKEISRGSTVLCAASMGLKRCEKRAAGNNLGREEITGVTVLKAGVALMSVVEEMLEEHGKVRA